MRPLIVICSVVAIAGCAGVQREAPKEAPATAAPPAAALPNLTIAKVFRSNNVRKGCPPQGNAKPDSVKALNILKNRVEPPADGDLDPAVTLEAMLQPGDDEDRWDESKAGELVGFVHDVKVGGIETTNCKATNPADRDTHIELVIDPAHAGPSQRIVVEVTPRWRDRMSAQNLDWSTETLKHDIKGHWVRIRGWLFFDQEHVDQAENTNPGNDKNWRASVWELHPISGIEVMAAPPQ